MPRSVFMQIMHENHEFACAKINAIDFVCINCCWNEVRVNSNIRSIVEGLKVYEGFTSKAFMDKMVIAAMDDRPDV